MTREGFLAAVSMLGVACAKADPAPATDANQVARNGSHHACGEAYKADPRDDTMTGELVRIVTNDKGTPEDPSDDEYDLLLPQEMLDWLAEQNWIQVHGDWHNIRRWDQGCRIVPPGGSCQSVDEMTARGLQRAPIQEREPGDGIAFLAMHRHMLRGFREAFPKHADALRAFEHIPVNKDDPENPLPWRDVLWAGDQLESVSMMENVGEHLNRFLSEDDYARWVQFGDGFGGFGFPGGFGLPEGGLPPGFPGGFALPDGGLPPLGGGFPGGFTPPDGGLPAALGAGDAATPERPAGGIHGPLHAQWTVAGSPYSLVDNDSNVRNFAFWRLHGWIDAMWERYRKARGLAEDDPEYQKQLIDQCEEMHELGHARARGETAGVFDAGGETGVFATEIAPILHNNCGGSQCHGATSPTLGLTLAGALPSIVREGLVGKRSAEMSLSLVEPGQPERSWLYRKISGDFTGLDCSTKVCTQMPLAGLGLSDDEIERIRNWIAAGAPAQ